MNTKGKHMSKLVLCVGLPSSRKSAWIERHCAATGAIKVSPEEVAAMLHGRTCYLSGDQWAAIRESCRIMTEYLLVSGVSVVVDGGCSLDRVGDWRAAADSAGAMFVVEQVVSRGLGLRMPMQFESVPMSLR